MSQRPIDVPLAALPTEWLARFLDPRGRRRLELGLTGMERLMRGRVLWNINSTPAGGGVAEMLSSLLPYLRGAGIDARWKAIEGGGCFFAFTKRLHNLVHGETCGGVSIGEAERRVYETSLKRSAVALAEMVRPGDVVILHDPQTAGLAAALKAQGAIVVWRAHGGTARRNRATIVAWRFLAPYLEEVDHVVFSSADYVPPEMPDVAWSIIQPSIDPASTKNEPMEPGTAHAILDCVGLGRLEAADYAHAAFVRQDGSPGRVEHGAEVMRTGGPPRLGEEPLVVQVSRWDRLKDPVGVLRGFSDHVLPHESVQLVLAGPTVHSVADDPEAAATFDEVLDAWRALPHSARRQSQLACLPMRDLEENAAIVNALQRSATVIVQKSIEEGFGLTVAEAMWKGRPVVASDVGGLGQQVEDGVSGLLVGDPHDLAAFGGAVSKLIKDRALADELGRNGVERVRRDFLHDRQIADHERLLLRLLG